MHYSIQIPHFEAYLSREFAKADDEELCIVHRLISAPGHALRFSVLTERGALFHGVPIHMLALRPGAPEMPLETLCLWDAFGIFAVAYQDTLRHGMSVEVKLGDGNVYEGESLFSIDWFEPLPYRTLSHGWSEMPEQHKEAHVLALDNGRLAAQPGNKLIWLEPSFVTRPWNLRTERPNYTTNSESWSVEGRRRTEASDRQYYDTTDDAPSGAASGAAEDSSNHGT